MGNNNGRFSDGFLMGALIGGAAVFLLGTEKGNKVLKVILEEGRASFGELMNEIDEYREEMAEETGELEFVEDEVDEVVETAKVPSGTASNSSPKSKSSSSRKFFRKK